MNFPEIPRSERRDLRHNIRQDLLYRLRWDVFAALEKIEVAAGPLGKEEIIPFFGSPYAKEPLGKQLPKRLEIHAGELQSKRDFDYAPEEFRYRPPPPAILHNDEDSPVTMEQFVTRAHEYLNAHKEAIIKYKSMVCERIKQDNGVDVQFFYWRIMAWGNDELGMVSVDMIANVEWPSINFWETQINNARRVESGQDRGPISGLAPGCIIGPPPGALDKP